ncbi:MAG: hypothetical protein ACYTG5_11355 [Planctomycetota bacterium]|jgi:hypothetical protein
MNKPDHAGIAMSHLLVLAGVAVGLALVILPMFPDNRPMDMPESFVVGSESHNRLLSVSALVDQACRTGDLETLKGLLSERYLAEVARDLPGGKDLDTMLLESKSTGIVGDFSGKEYVLGVAGQGRAVIVYRSDRPDPVLQAIVFYWDGSRFQLDAKASMRRKTWQLSDAKAQASFWAQNFLRGR